MVVKNNRFGKPLAGLFLAGSLVLGSAQLSAQLGDEGLPPQPQQDSGEAQIRAQLQQIEEQLFEAQRMALETDSVKELQEALQEMINDFIVGLEPDLEVAVDRREELLEQLEDNPELQDPTQQPSEEVMGMIQEYQSIEQEVAPLRAQAFEDPEIMEAHQGFQERLLGVMEEIEPQTQALLNQREQLVRQFQQMQQQQQQQMQPQQPQQQQQPQAPGGY